MKSNSQMLVQQLLFDHPLYNWCDESNTINILLLGDGEYAATFVDFALQVGQMMDKQLSITWCISDTLTKETYLKTRPALADFIDIDDNVHPDMYGHLSFKITNDILSCFSTETQYVFLTSDNLEENKENSQLIKQAGNSDCFVAYIDGEKICVFNSDTVYTPEYQEIQQAKETISSKDELDRMAFNTHVIWAGEGNLDSCLLQKVFEKPYNKNSSVSFVLSIGYKLHSIGINESDPYKAASSCFDVIRKAGNNPKSNEADLLKRIAALEHRRWVLSLVTRGAVPLREKEGKKNYQICVKNASIKQTDTSGNLIMHPCIERSTSDTPLQDIYSNNTDLWDHPSASDAMLDDLDLVSVQLHREMLSAATEIITGTNTKKEDVYRYLSDLQLLCEKYGDIAKRDFDRFQLCVNNIFARNKRYAEQYASYENTITKSIKFDNGGISLLNNIHRILFPIIESCLYKDYKQYDMELIKQIPFILTGKNNIHICMPFGTTAPHTRNNNHSFKSVASATSLYAKTITYLYIVEESTDIDFLISKISAIKNYFDYRNHPCKLYFELLCSKEISKSTLYNHLSSRLTSLKAEKVLTAVHTSLYSDVDGIGVCIRDIIQSRKIDYFDGTNAISDSMLINKAVIDASIACIPYFEFDSLKRQFTHYIGCDYLKYQKITSFIQVEDMFALMNAQDKEYNYPDSIDFYQDCWEIYSGKSLNEESFTKVALCWTSVCDFLKSGGVKTLEINGKVPAVKDKELFKNILRKLKEKSLLSSLSIKGDDVSATIANTRISKMFTKAGNLLEEYVYYEACKTGWFDDVQTGYKFRWEFDEVENELDCVLTKGYKSVLVECKSVKTPDESFYLNLDSLADHFGIGQKKVLIMISNTGERYISRGKQLDIITISSKEELDHIGERLIEIMKQ